MIKKFKIYNERIDDEYYHSKEDGDSEEWDDYYSKNDDGDINDETIDELVSSLTDIYTNSSVNVELVSQSLDIIGYFKIPKSDKLGYLEKILETSNYIIDDVIAPYYTSEISFEVDRDYNDILVIYFDYNEG